MNRNNEWYITGKMLMHERISFTLLGASLVLTIIGVIISPNQVPIHWGFSVEPDAYGPPWIWLVMWLIITAAVALLSLMTRKLDVSKWSKPYAMKGEMLESWYSFSMSIIFNIILFLAVIELAFSIVFLAKLYAIMHLALPAITIAIIAYSVYSLTKWKSLKKNL